MKKKLVIGFMSAILLSGCGMAHNNNNNSHIHTYDTTWQYTSKGHYRNCIYTGCNEHSPIAEHTYDDDSNVCNVCGYVFQPNIKEHIHDWSEYETYTEPSCTEKGMAERICVVCGAYDEKAIKALGHDYRDDATGNVAPTCTESGVKYQTCSRCGDKKTIHIAPLGHDWVDDEAGLVAPTCTEPGMKNQTCSRCGAKNEGVVIDALWHDYITSTEDAVPGYARLTSSICTRCTDGIIFWNATDVSDACKNDKRLGKAGDEENGIQDFYEPNYIENSDGSVSFWGRPINNAIELEDDGVPSDNAPIYDSSVVGSFLEYKFTLENSISNAVFFGDFAINKYMTSEQKVFTNVSTDWTLGIIDADNNFYENRYVVSIDGNVLEQDLTNDIPASNKEKQSYDFPLKDKINLSAGEHTVRITMAGGFKASFYHFGFAF